MPTVKLLGMDFTCDCGETVLNAPVKVQLHCQNCGRKYGIALYVTREVEERPLILDEKKAKQIDLLTPAEEEAADQAWRNLAAEEKREAAFLNGEPAAEPSVIQDAELFPVATVDGGDRVSTELLPAEAGRF